MRAEDTGALALRIERAAEAVYERRVEGRRERTTERKLEISPSLIGRITCWVLFGGLTLTAAILSFQYWSGHYKAPTGMISWLSYLGTLSYVGALTIQMTVNQRRILAAVERVDPVGIGQLAAQMQAGEVDRDRVLRRLDRVEQLLHTLTEMVKDSVDAQQEIAAMKERQDDLERDLAALVIAGRKPGGEVNGTVHNLRPARPERTF